MSELVYAIQTAIHSHSGIKMIDVKIGRTTNISSRLSQYRGSHWQAKILDLWKKHPERSLSNCESGILTIAEEYAQRRSREIFVFIQSDYEVFANAISNILKHTTRADVEEELESPQSTRGELEEKVVREFDVSRGTTTLDDIVVVIQLMKEEGLEWRAAIRERAEDRSVVNATIRAHCTRDIGLSTDEFLEKVEQDF